MTALDDFREETRTWLAENCPESMRTPMPAGELVDGGSKLRSSNPDSYVWLESMAEKGWTVPSWPKEYGGIGSRQHTRCDGLNILAKRVLGLLD